MAKKHRAYWKGYLRLSLVTIAVEVYNAVESKNEISFRQIHKPSGKRVHYEKVAQGIGKIDSADIAKGYEVDTDTYVILEPEEIEALLLRGFDDRPPCDARHDDCLEPAMLRTQATGLDVHRFFCRPLDAVERERDGLGVRRRRNGPDVQQRELGSELRSKLTRNVARVSSCFTEIRRDQDVLECGHGDHAGSKSEATGPSRCNATA